MACSSGLSVDDIIFFILPASAMRLQEVTSNGRPERWCEIVEMVCCNGG